MNQRDAKGQIRGKRERAIKLLIGLVGAYTLLVLVFEDAYLSWMQPSFEEAECRGLSQVERRARGGYGIPMIQLVIEYPDKARESTMLARFEMVDAVYV